MNISERISEVYRTNPDAKDFLTFISIHAKGNVLHLGLCEKGYGVLALLYGIEQHGGHIWSVIPYCPPIIKTETFYAHPQWTLIESDPLEVQYARTGGVPEEVDLLFVNASFDQLDTVLMLKTWGHIVTTKGLIIVAGIKNHSVKSACEDFADSYGMKFRVRGDTDLGVIFYPDNKEALKNE